MPNSANLSIPFVQASQAQKHVTVNEAFEVLDAVVQLRLVSTTTTTPPGTGVEGDAYGIPSGATGLWSANIGDIAIWANGGWIFVSPKVGWQAWIEDLHTRALFDGTNWQAGSVCISANGAISIDEIIEYDVTLGAGGSQLVASALPAGAVVTGVSGRVTTAITGSLSAWRLGVVGSDNRYGSGIGTAAQSWMSGLTSSPLTYYADTDLLLTAEGGDFASGSLRLAVHLRRILPPNG